MRSAFRIALVPLILAAGCVPHLEWKGFSPILPAQPPPGAHPRAPAVILTDETEILMFWEGNERPFTTLQRHEVRAIRSEAGFKWAEVRIPFPAKAELELLDARTITPDGRVVPVEASRILEDEARRGPAEDLDRVRYKIFRFPAVQVGSLLEYVYRVKRPWMERLLWGRVGDGLPVRHARIDLRLSRGLRYALKLYNRAAPFTTKEEGGLVHTTIDIDDVPGSRGEAALPPWQRRDPFWMFRNKQFWIGVHVMDAYLDWDAAMKGLATLVFDDGKYWKGMAPWKPSAECTSRRCKVEQAMALCRDRVEFSGFDDRGPPRPLKEAMATGFANDDEKALCLVWALKQAGVETRLALDNRGLGGVVDKEFPAPVLLEHQFVFLPAQKGIEKPVFIDPSCEYCALGQVPAAIAGDEALVVWIERHALGADVTRAEFRRVEGERAGDDAIERRYEARLSPEGDLEVAASERATGQAAADLRAETRVWGEDKWRDWAEKFAARRHPSARILDEKPGQSVTSDRARGRYERALRLSLPGYATADRAPDHAPDQSRLVVPLSVFWSGYDDELLSEARQHPVFYERSDRVTEEAVFPLPPGHRVVELPAASHLRSALFDLDFDVRVEGEKGDRVIARRTLAVHAGEVPKEKYGEVRAVLRAFAESRQKVFVLARGAGAAAAVPGKSRSP